MLLILSRQQLRSLLLSSPLHRLIKQVRNGEDFSKRFHLFSLSPPWHPIGTSAAASGDEAWTCLFGAKEGYLQRTKALSRDLSLWRRTGRKELMSGWKREGVMVQEKERRGDEKDRMYRRKARWENTGAREERNVKRSRDAECISYSDQWQHLHVGADTSTTTCCHMTRLSISICWGSLWETVSQDMNLAVRYLWPCWVTCAVKHVLKDTSGEANKALHTAKERQGKACEELSIVLLFYPCLNWQSYFWETQGNIFHV